MDNKCFQTIVETPEFLKQAEKCLPAKYRESLINFLAAYPTKGEIIPNTGGVRKLRWKNTSSKGKSGGVRVIYYYYNSEIPIFLFTVYGKNKKANLSMKERNDLKSLIQSIVENHQE